MRFHVIIHDPFELVFGKFEFVGLGVSIFVVDHSPKKHRRSRSRGKSVLDVAAIVVPSAREVNCFQTTVLETRIASPWDRVPVALKDEIKKSANNRISKKSAKL